MNHRAAAGLIGRSRPLYYFPEKAMLRAASLFFAVSDRRFDVTPAGTALCLKV